MPLVVTCPSCSARVAPRNDRTCPACGRPIPPDSVPHSQQEHHGHGPSQPTAPATPREAWDLYLETLAAPPEGEQANPLRAFEGDFSTEQLAAAERLRSSREANPAFAGRIQSELLPRFDDLIARIQRGDEGAPRSELLLEGIQARRESWRLLAEALAHADQGKFEEHVESWDRSELMLVRAISDFQRPLKPTPAQLVGEFSRALVTFTPRVIATPALLWINIVVFVLMALSGAGVFEADVPKVLAWGANNGPLTLSGQWWRLFTSMFLHFGIMHLAFNMWALLNLGGLVERLVGNTGFVILYVISGISGSIASLAWNPHAISAGASGAIFGVAGALLGLIVLRRDTVPAPVFNQLKSSMLAFVGFNIFLGFTTPMIDSAAHLGGLAGGFLCGLMLSQPLGKEMVARRPRKNLTLAVTAGVALFASTFALPPAPMDSETEFRQFADQIGAGEQRFNELAHSDLPSAELADTLEKDVLEPWRKNRAFFAEMGKHRALNKRWEDVMNRYLSAFESACRLRIEGLREKDDAKLKQANEQMDKANQAMEDLSKLR